MMWVTVGDDGRIQNSMTGNGSLEGGIQVAIPEGFDVERQFDWRLENGVLVYDPVTPV